MGLFDFFKKKDGNQFNADSGKHKLTKDEVGDLILIALNKLCDDTSTVEDAKKLIQSKGYDEMQSNIIANKAYELYLNHFANKKKD